MHPIPFLEPQTFLPPLPPPAQICCDIQRRCVRVSYSKRVDISSDKQKIHFRYLTVSQTAVCNWGVWRLTFTVPVPCLSCFRESCTEGGIERLQPMTVCIWNIDTSVFRDCPSSICASSGCIKVSDTTDSMVSIAETFQDPFRVHFQNPWPRSTGSQSP